jgi:hypothetical protein
VAEVRLRRPWIVGAGVRGARPLAGDRAPVARCQVTETGVAVAVTLSPGTVAVFDSGAHSAGLIHTQVGRLVSCKAFWAGLERITGLGSPRVWRASAASTAGSGGAGPPPAAGPTGAAVPIGQASVCTVTWQPAGTQPNVSFSVPWHPPAATRRAPPPVSHGLITTNE